jgi:hypothetical protein
MSTGSSPLVRLGLSSSSITQHFQHEFQLFLTYLANLKGLSHPQYQYPPHCARPVRPATERPAAEPPGGQAPGSLCPSQSHQLHKKEYRFLIFQFFQRFLSFFKKLIDKESFIILILPSTCKVQCKEAPHFIFCKPSIHIEKFLFI